MVKLALISVYNKEGIVEFAKELAKLGFEIISTGGTYKLLRENNVNVKEVSSITNFPEMLDGRVKTLHPKIHAGILAKMDNKEHVKQLTQNNIEHIDIVVCNLYPFEETISKNSTFEDAIENIDIGGPSMLRSAAKNFKDVIVITEPEDYKWIIEELKKGEISFEKRKELAKKVFQKTAVYDALISNYLNENKLFPERLLLAFNKRMSMRYGENPHQKAAFYTERNILEPCISSAKMINGGKELSYNNIMDGDAAVEIVKEFEEPAASVIKHANPSGAAASEKIEDALEKAYNCDPLSAYGCIIALNRRCNKKCAEFVKGKFVEVIISPSYDKDALEILKEKKNLRILEIPEFENYTQQKEKEALTLKKVVGGLLVQTREYPDFSKIELKCVTSRKPSDKEIKDMIFAAKICKHVKSNCVLLAKDLCTVGIGAGQMSRVESSMLAARKAGEKAKGSVMASDAFFPFRDGVDEAAKAGIAAIIQPGGSIRDNEVIQAANEHNIAMVFSGVRLFKH